MRDKFSLLVFLQRLFLTLTVAWFAVAAYTGSATFDIDVYAQTKGEVPGGSLGNKSDAQFWDAINRGRLQGSVSIPNKSAGQAINRSGVKWLQARNGPLLKYGAYAMLGIVLLLGVFYALRGRIEVGHGFSGKLIQRFNSVERFGHWLLANSFILLALTGLNLLYGREFVLPLIGPDAFALITTAGKYIHNYVAFAFIAGLVIILVLWIKENFPNKHDVIWLLKGGGMFAKDSHPPAKKFNAGQKIVFWIVILGGASISASGVALMFPFEFALFEPTFAVLNGLGFNLPTTLNGIEEMQLAQLWHAIVGLGLIVVIIAHIYIGTAGIEGAFDAMSTGDVDENWAKEHHSVWVEEQKQQEQAGGDD